MTRTRFAPSPTGYLHIGGLRTCLYNVLLARQTGGKFLLRVEDTDRERYVPGAVEALLTTLTRVGLSPDEGPKLVDGLVVQQGDVGPYIQSERLPLYQTYAQQLLEAGKAYYCFCSSERLESLRKQQEIAKLQTKYDRRCLTLTPDEIKTRLSANEPHVVRLKMPDGESVFEDMIRGRIAIHNSEMDDQVLMKADGFPTYHLAVVVDDHLMGITHIIRGEEWISSTPKHVTLYSLFGWEAPKFAHLPLILNPDKSKLSKRQGDVAVEDFLDKGYLPEALVNFVALLGFNPKSDQEIYTVEELVSLFDLSKVNKSGAVLDTAKLDWMNAQYIMKKSPIELVEAVKPFIARAGKSLPDDLLLRICTIEQPRLTRLTDVIDLIDGYLTLPEYDIQMVVWKKADATDAKKCLQGIKTVVESFESNVWNDIALIESTIKRYISDNGLQNGNVLWPTRVALSGRSASPSPFELLFALQKQESVKRLEFAINTIA